MSIINSAHLWSSKSSFLHTATIRGDKTKVFDIINENVISVNTLDHWGRSALIYATFSNNVDIVELLIKIDAEIERLDVHQRSGIFYAVKNDSFGSLKLLLQALEKRINSKNMESSQQQLLFKDEKNGSVLHLAAKLESPKCLQLLLKCNVSRDLNCKDCFMRTPLHWGAMHCSTESLQLLLKHGVDCRSKDRVGNLAIHYAAKSSTEASKNCLQVLLTSMPNTACEKDSRGLTPIHLAVTVNSLVKVKLLLSFNKNLIHNVDEQGRTAVHYACAGGHLEILKFLISSGGDINQRDNFGASPLHYAAKNNHTSVVELIVETEDAKEMLTFEGETPIHWATLGGSIKSMLTLINHGGSVLKSDAKGRTPFHSASLLSDGASLVNILLRVKAAAEMIKADDGCLPLHYAAQKGNLKIIHLLLKADSSAIHGIDSMGRNALHHSVIGGNLQLTQILIETGIHVDSSDLYGMTSLHLATYLGFSDVLALLLENFAQPNAVDNQGRSALHLGAMMGHKDSVNVLLEKGAYVNIIDATPERWTPLNYAILHKSKSNGNSEEDLVSTLSAAGGRTGNWIREIAAITIQRNWKIHNLRNLSLRSNSLGYQTSLSSGDKFYDVFTEVEKLRSMHRWQKTSNSHETSQFGPRNNPITPSSNFREISRSEATGTIFYPLMTPYFPDELYNNDISNGNGLERSFNGHDDETEVKYLRNDETDVTLKMVGGSDLESARKAWQERLSTLTIQTLEDD